ncbi:MAG: T9SS type A sorting domain-containing protein [Bacteroidetes bacterium]|nr:T9SS type A sorting domain-containing protein [Bacteroidota bacterium]
MKKLTSFLLFVFFLFPLLCLAQWSSDPNVNTEIKNSSDWEVTPKIVTDQNGLSYISWFSGDALNFNVYMQRLDSEGYKLWGTEGLMISDNPTWSWVTDYSLIIDNEDNAVLATQDIRTGYSNAYAYRMSQDAGFLWGDNGVILSNNTDFNPFPKVIETSGGDFIFVFDRDPDLKSDLERITMQKVSASGNVLWGDGKEISNDTLKYYFSVPIYTEDDHYIVAWLYRPENDTVFPGHPVFFHIYTQKFDLGGNPVWPDPVRVDTGNIMSYLDDFVILQLANDGNGGVFISWDTEIFYILGNIVVQHIDQNGNLDWPYPIEVSTNYNNERWEPNIYADINNEELYLFWVEYHYDGVNLLDCFGIGGQKMSFAGQRMWSDTAKIFVELECSNDTAYFDQIIRPSTENDIAVFYIKTFVNFGPPDTLIEGEIYAMRINPAGEFVWTSERVTVSSYPGEKCYIAVSECKANQWIATWSDIRESKTPGDVSDYGIYAQNVHLDGSLGPLGIDDYSSINSASVVIYPNPFNGNTTINIELNSAEKICLSLYNLHGQLITNISDDWLNPGNNIYHYDGSYLDAGIYFLELKNGNNRLYTKMVKVD